MNKVFLLGRLTKDPELRQTMSNIPVASFTVACNRPYNKDKEKQADFIDCVAWRSSAEFVGKYFTKGKPILVEGSVQVRGYEDKQGNKRRAWEVVCDSVSFVEGAAKDESRPSLDAAKEGEFQQVDGYDDLPFD